MIWNDYTTYVYQLHRYRKRPISKTKVNMIIFTNILFSAGVSIPPKRPPPLSVFVGNPRDLVGASSIHDAFDQHLFIFDAITPLGNGCFLATSSDKSMVLWAGFINKKTSSSNPHIIEKGDFERPIGS